MATNGGYGGVQMALSHGVPLVVAGKKRRQARGRRARRVVGLRHDSKTAKPTAERIRTAVRALLHDPRYRTRAQALAAEYALRCGGATVDASRPRCRAGRKPPDEPLSAKTAATPYDFKEPYWRATAAWRGFARSRGLRRGDHELDAAVWARPVPCRWRRPGDRRLRRWP